MTASSYIIEEDDLQGFAYSVVLMRVYPDPTSYHNWLVYDGATDDTSPDLILDDILEKYSAAWTSLADL